MESDNKCPICGSPNIRPDGACTDCLDRWDKEEWRDYLSQFKTKETER
jgi:hypothetical protein